MRKKVNLSLRIQVYLAAFEIYPSYLYNATPIGLKVETRLRTE